MLLRYNAYVQTHQLRSVKRDSASHTASQEGKWTNKMKVVAVVATWVWRQDDVLSSRRADLQAARQGLIITEARPPRKPVSGVSAGAYSNQTASPPLG